jgi:hypothetical protein
VRRKLITASVLAGVGLTAANALAAQPSQLPAGSGGIGVRLIDVPSSSSSDELAHAYIVERLAPGTRVRRRIEVSNSTDSSAQIVIYPAGARLRKGNFAFAPGHSPNDVSTWTSVSHGGLRLQPGTKALETVTIDVPADAAPGEHYAVVWAQVSGPAPAGGGVRLVNRVGVRVYLSVGPGGIARPSFTIGALKARRAANGDPFVVAEIRNTGTRTLELSGSLMLSAGPGGVRAGPFLADVGTTLGPKDSGSVIVRLGKAFPVGPWHARLRLSSGSVERTAEATIRFPGRTAVVGTPAAGTGSKGPRTVILALGALLAGLAVATSVGLHISRRGSLSA